MSETTNFSNVNTSSIKESQNYVDWRKQDIYEVLRDVYWGDGGIGGIGEKCYLVSNMSELFFQTRRSLTPFAPWFQLFLDAQYAPLYTEEPPVYDLIDANMPFIEDVNRAGTSLDDFKQEVTLYSLMDGVDFLASGFDADDAKYPWFHYYSAPQYNECLSEEDEFGAVTVYVFTNKKVDDKEEEYYEHNRYTNTIGDVKGTYQEYRSEEKDSLGDKEGEETPFFKIDDVYSQRREQGKILPRPATTNIAGLCISVYNSESDQRWVLRVQGHSIFVITADVAPEGFGDGLTQGFRIDVTENQGGAEFVAPPAELSKEQRESKAELLGQLFEVMRHGGVIAQRSSQIPESGASKAFTFRPVNTAISKSRKIAMQIDRYIEDAFLFYTSKTIDLNVTYKKDFTPSAGLEVADLIAILDEFKTIGADESTLATLKQIAMLIGADESVLDEIDNLTLDAVVAVPPVE